MDGLLNINYNEFMSINMMLPSVAEQIRISDHLRKVDRLITLHQCKCQIIRFKCLNDWEQRKLGEYAEIVGGGTPSTNVSAYWDGDIDTIDGEIGGIIFQYALFNNIVFGCESFSTAQDDTVNNNQWEEYTQSCIESWQESFNNHLYDCNETCDNCDKCRNTNFVRNNFSQCRNNYV